MPRNFRKTPEISSLREDQELMKLKFLTETTCSNHVLKLEILVELVSQLISATAEICSLAVVVMVSSESSTLSTMYDPSLYVIMFQSL